MFVFLFFFFFPSVDTSIGHQWIALDDLDQCEIGRWIASRVLNLVAMLPE